MSQIDLRAFMPAIVTSNQRFLAQLQALVYNEWSNLADNLPVSNRTRAEYRNALTYSNVTYAAGTMNGDVSLEGAFPNMFEQGMGPEGIGSQGPYDVGKFILKPGARSLRRNAEGKMYVNVPFGHSKKELSGYGKNIMSAARKLAPTTSVPMGDTMVTKWGGKFGAGQVPKLAEHHHSDPLAGMVRKVSTYSAAAKEESMFMTWRRITEGGKPWMSPGIKANWLSEKVIQKIPEMLNQL